MDLANNSNNAGAGATASSSSSVTHHDGAPPPTTAHWVCRRRREPALPNVLRVACRVYVGMVCVCGGRSIWVPSLPATSAPRRWRPRNAGGAAAAACGLGLGLGSPNWRRRRVLRSRRCRHAPGRGTSRPPLGFPRRPRARMSVHHAHSDGGTSPP
jgi:hypothetical protein